MKPIKKEDGWWVTEIPECGDCGPYPTKADALETQRGLQRTFDHMDDWSFWTCEKKPKKARESELQPESQPESSTEVPTESQPKRRKQRSDKGKPRGPRKKKPGTTDESMGT
jgi:hypothetical protein